MAIQNARPRIIPLQMPRAALSSIERVPIDAAGNGLTGNAVAVHAELLDGGIDRAHIGIEYEIAGSLRSDFQAG
jgi:hypothetical protein